MSLTNEDISPANQHDDHKRVVVIHIDRKRYDAPAPVMTGAQLRVLAEPDIGPDFDLWQEVPGHEDNLVANDEAITLANGMHFYSSPSAITPG